MGARGSGDKWPDLSMIDESRRSNVANNGCDNSYIVRRHHDWQDSLIDATKRKRATPRVPPSFRGERANLVRNILTVAGELLSGSRNHRGHLALRRFITLSF